MRRSLIAFLFFTSSVAWAQTIDVKHVALNLSFNWEKRQAMGEAKISLTILNSTNTILLDAAQLTINSIKIDSSDVQFTNLEKQDKLEIKLNKVYESGSQLTLIIDYHTNYENKSDPNSIAGSFGKGLRFFEPTSTTPNKHKQLWSSGEPDNNKYWFPCNENFADVHTTEITATVEKPLMLIANGDLIEIKDNTNNTRTYHYNTTNPFPNYLVAIVVGEYVDVNYKCNNTLIHNYGYTNEKEAVKATTEMLPEMLRFMEEKTGYKYPFSSYSQVVVQDYPFPGLVGQNAMVVLSDNYIDDEGVHKDYKYLWDGIAVQALSNQWFGNLLMPKSEADIWLNNAFGQYFAGLYTQKDNGRTEYLTWYYPYEKWMVQADWDAQNIHPILTTNYLEHKNYSSDSYSKYRGALVLKMLQKEVGEENWWKAIKYYVKENANKLVSTADFQKAIEVTSGKSFKWFFDQWIYKVGMPNFELSKKYDSKLKTLSITIKQTPLKLDSIHYNKVEYFEGIVDVEINGKIEAIRLLPKQENVFTFKLNAAPKFVNFNYEQVYLCNISENKSEEEYLNQLKGSKDVLAKQQALVALILIANDTTVDVTLKSKIIDAFKNEVKTNYYWRYRVYALGSLRKILSPPYDKETTDMLLHLIETEKTWLKTAAITSLGNSMDSKYIDVYKKALDDSSDRVINAAAIALGKTKDKRVLQTLLDLDKKPSWKSQNKISALNGLQQLGDTSAIAYVLSCIKDNQSPRWYLATPAWDYPFAAVNTIVALGKSELAFPILFERLKNSLNENDLNDIFQNVQLINLLNDKRASEMYQLLKTKFKDDILTLEAVSNFENQYLESIKEK